MAHIKARFVKAEDSGGAHVSMTISNVCTVWNTDTTRKVLAQRKDANEIFAYLKDGNYPIDNNLERRSIRKLTTQRNSMLHFGSDQGVEMALPTIA